MAIIERFQVHVIERLSCFRGSYTVCGRYREVVPVSERHLWTL